MAVPKSVLLYIFVTVPSAVGGQIRRHSHWSVTPMSILDGVWSSNSPGCEARTEITVEGNRLRIGETGPVVRLEMQHLVMKSITALRACWNCRTVTIWARPGGYLNGF
jgi:hypothetical protein